MRGGRHDGGRHRLGDPGLVHCTAHPEVAAALARRRGSWWSVLRTPAQHSLTGRRSRPQQPAPRWLPAQAA
ncbi:hypothetical protein LX15_004844 [Streptoalloteichus tenebrarius]|uniref:Uncharacterized protein n=1 Tax=Streptoalloteichus tenebrarius (strain ATCC 17920 / DSM 40477 / JCM 4838 / CBS 697.72 / NBRC 16177 / NCIMB 11028 / NRRL B-12390 / A12253. 1 / ISP 5477) TaxID=1933 RepID=A0ABT1I037_STRSD|nr:hypothetical protein [Streptoalloteichus tenebrarius]MCP2261124.1 hypothetical protein [Streptoalloteichus tenebrarius]BFF03967.1 hypothetical protein GCM10020241_56420 [Streptoalloteichus tenebrarius]